MSESDSACALCEATGELTVFTLDAPPTGDHAHELALCGTCHAQLQPEAELDPKHWFCLQGAIWSELAAAKVVSWRLLQRLRGDSWAQDLLEQAYFDDEVLAWAQATGAQEDADDDRKPTVDSNGTRLEDGDTVTLIRDLDVKGATFTAKQGTRVKGIRLTDNPEHVEGRVNKVAIVLKTCFLKKA